jgi:hypothetical protein
VIAGQKLTSQLKIGLSPTGASIVKRYGLSVAGCLRQANVAWNHSGIEAFAEVLAEGKGNLLCEIGSVVVHGEEDTLNAEVRIEGCANTFERGNELGDAFQGEVLSLHGDDEGVGGHQDIEGEEVECGRAVKDNQVEVILDGLEGMAEAKRAIRGASQLDIGAGKVLGAWKEPEQIDFGGQNDLNGGSVAHQDVIDGVSVVIPLNPDTGSSVGLRVAVGEKDFEPFKSEAGSEVDRRSGFADSALLIDNAEYSSHGDQE